MSKNGCKEMAMGLGCGEVATVTDCTSSFASALNPELGLEFDTGPSRDLVSGLDSDFRSTLAFGFGVLRFTPWSTMGCGAEYVFAAAAVDGFVECSDAAVFIAAANVALNFDGAGPEDEDKGG